jgi:hypothetical protein
MWLGRGINFGNALDALPGVTSVLELTEHHFDVVRDAGFDTVRLPVWWSGHAGAAAPYRIDPDFLVRVDWAVANALDRNLNVVLLGVRHGLRRLRPATKRLARAVAAGTAADARRGCLRAAHSPRPSAGASRGGTRPTRQ